MACIAGSHSPISSRKSVPPSASLNAPIRSSTAPVKAPFLWPKSSDSSSSLEMAAQLIATNFLSLRGLASWIALANISLPVPLSPRISTDTSRRAARRASPTATRRLRLSPTMPSKPCDSCGLWLGEALQPGVGVPQDLRHVIHHEVERDVS